MSSFTLDPSQIPAMTPPDGVTSNFVDPESRASATRIVICIALALMSLFLVLRVYSRLKTRGTFEVDDCESTILDQTVVEMQVND